MQEIELAYGRGSVNFTFDEDRFEVLTSPVGHEQPLTDVEIGEALNAPIESPPLEELLTAGESVLIVVSDATRASASAQIVNLLVRRIIQIGISTQDISIIFATGIHRAVSPEEKRELLTPFIFQRIKTLDHDAFDPRKLVVVEEASRGTRIELNHALREFSHVILTGAIGFHYFAGFTGGRKSICPGLAAAQTIEATHMLALDFEKGGRRSGVGTGLLDGNAVHEECERIANLVKPTFGINSVVDERGRAVRVYAGDWRAAHRLGCNEYLTDHSVRIRSKRDVVVASCGGSPYDINLIQAHKALDMAADACHDGGTIILLAECRDGLGRPDFLKWFDAKNSDALAARLREEYEVNGQTAWSLLTKAERYRVLLVSELPAPDVERMRMTPARSLTESLALLPPKQGYVLPRGAALLPRTTG
ncbi:MAG: nickel-dependent lactate racemase [Pyrinomonadaceae bacterium]